MKNAKEQYEEHFRNRKVKYINQYETPTFVYPSVEQYGTIQTVSHIWTTGDKFYKLAHKYYGDSRDWWIIAKFNNKPTESHLNIGDILYIPTNLQQVIRLMRG
jgi:nucleoid-associated protein YgaU